MAAFTRGCRGTIARLSQLGVPSATVALLRDAPGGAQCLLLRKSRSTRFGGLWVFPGGKVDKTDEVHHTDGTDGIDVLATAARAAAREAAEESDLADLSPTAFALLSHWVPPEEEAVRRGKRFSTFFFVGACAAGERDARADGGEVDSAQWLRPIDALERHAQGGLALLPPTWMTLDELATASAGGATASEALATLRDATPRAYATRWAEIPGGGHAYMWEGDAGWAECDPAAPGARLRLVATPSAMAASSAAGGGGPGRDELGLDSLGRVSGGGTVLSLERSPAAPSQPDPH